MSQLYPFCPLLCGQRTDKLIEHLKNCKNKNLLGVKYFQCEYNPSHIFGKKAYEKHIKKCPDKYKNNNRFNEPKEDEKINEKEKEKKIEKEKEKEENGDNIIFEDIDEPEKDVTIKRTIKRANTLTNSHKKIDFKDSKNEEKPKRKNSDSLEKYKEHIKEHNLLYNDEIDCLKENLKKIEILKEKKIKRPEKKIFSSSNLNIKGILKNKLKINDINIKKCNTLEKNCSSFRSYNSTSNSFKTFDDANTTSSIFDESSDDENINFQRKNFRRLSSKTVSFKGLVKVFVFNHNQNENNNNNKKIEHKRSAFAKSSIRKNINEKESDKEFREIYMKKL